MLLKIKTEKPITNIILVEEQGCKIFLTVLAKIKLAGDVFLRDFSRLKFQMMCRTSSAIIPTTIQNIIEVAMSKFIPVPNITTRTPNSGKTVIRVATSPIFRSQIKIDITSKIKKTAIGCFFCLYSLKKENK